MLFKNFITTLKRYSASALLNLLGLSVAYTAFIIIIIQVSFEYGYDTYNRNADRVYRVALHEQSGQEACWAQPVIDILGEVSPKIEAYTLYDELPWNQHLYVSVIRPNGGEEMFEITRSCAYNDIIKILDMQLAEGDTHVLTKPYQFLIPLSAAKAIWGNESAIGKTFTLSNETYQVGGVYKDFPANSVSGNYWYYSRTPEQKSGLSQVNYLFLVKLDKPESKEEITGLFNDRLREIYKDDGDSGNEAPPTAELTLIKDTYFIPGIHNDYSAKGNKAATDTMLAIAILILMVAVINYINFASATAPFRIKMLTLQKILGCNKQALIRGIIFESTVISLLAFIIALLLVASLQNSALSGHLIAGISFAGNSVPLCICGIVAILTGILAGLYPALYMTSISPVLAIKGSFGSSPKGRKLRNVLIGFQFCVSIALVIAAIFINLQNRFITNFPLGFETQRVLVTKIDRGVSRVKKGMVERLKQSPVIEDVAFADYRFGGTEEYEHWGASFGETPVEFNLMHVSPNFLEMMGIEIAEGRGFRPEDLLLPYSATVFNHITPKENGEKTNIGEGIKEDDNSYFNLEIIGFTKDNLHTLSMRVPEEAFAFIVGGGNQGGESMHLGYMYTKIKKGADLFGARDSVIRICKSFLPAYPFDPVFMDTVAASLYEKERNTNYIVTLFSLLTIMISLVGVFGLVFFETQFRRKETGVRRVHGATVNSILRMYNKKYLTILAICFVIAAPLSYYILKLWISGFTYRIPLYGWVFLLGFVIIAFLTVVTVTFRSWKHANENPANSLKNE